MSTYDPGWKPEVLEGGTGTACENHDVPGSCTQECAWLTDAMGGDGYTEPQVYSDYLGGTSSYDVSGCHGGPPMPEQTIVFDPDARRVFVRVTHPDGCSCDAHEGVCLHCAQTIYEDDNGAGGKVWVHYFGSTVCHDDPPGSHEDGDTTTVAEPTMKETQ